MIDVIIVYLAGMVGVYYVLAIRALSGYRGKLFALLSIVPLSAIAIFRGPVGTDTASYEIMVGQLRSMSDWYGVEPGFSFLVWMLGWITDSDVILVRLISLVFALGLLWFIRRADKDELFFLLAFFLPVYFYRYSMNALRIGLATIFMLLVIRYLRNCRTQMGFIYAFLGWLFHYSLIATVAFITVAARVLSARSLALFSFMSFLFLLFILVNYSEYIIPRIIGYQDHESPSVLSGLSSLLILSAVLFGALVSSIERSNKILFLLLSFLFVSVAFVVSRYSYAGLRFLDLLVFAVPATLLVLHGKSGVLLNWKVKFAFVIAGLIGLAADLRAFALTPGEGPTPWVPFEWLF